MRFLQSSRRIEEGDWSKYLELMIPKSKGRDATYTPVGRDPAPGSQCSSCQVIIESKEYKYKERVVNPLAIHEVRGLLGKKPHREVDCLSTSMVRVDPFFLAIDTWGITYGD
ncbi:hypothetical protein L2E82_08375 [Cichorium intybus]|uniref:Uncharacterized protein n=1 Tax=Cichorium intybus TaxID=13427 RepID=A0ACB9G891_CICIN|nr:hypothetical protein L2E82_08375 [Cichorium intybus]